MSKFLKYLTFCLLAAFLLAGLTHFVTNKKDYKEARAIKAPIETLAYEVAQVKFADIDYIKAPKLPDISGYTIENIKAKIPELKEGVVNVMSIRKGFKFIRSQEDEIGGKQGRLEPEAIVIEEGVYGLNEIVTAVNDDELITKINETTFVLYAPLSVRPSASLVIADGEKLLMSATTGASLSTFGDTYIVNASVLGWNTEEDKPAYYSGNKEEHRPFVVAWCGANLNIAGSTIAHLGYGDSKSYGLTYTSCTDTIYREDYSDLTGGTGVIVDNNFYDMYFGFYSYEVHNVAIVGNLYEDNVVYGIDPHDRSTNLIIAKNVARGTKEKHGIIISREVSKSFVFENVSENNKGSGIMIDRDSHDNIIAYNTSMNNGLDGLTFYESPRNLSYKNKLINNTLYGMRVRNSQNIVSFGDIINFNQKGVRLYSSDLLLSESGKNRDLKLDPYEQITSLNIIKSELVGNQTADFNFTGFAKAQIVSPTLFKSPSKVFAGDLTRMDNYLLPKMREESSGVLITAK